MTHVKYHRNELHDSGHKINDSAHQVENCRSLGGGVFSFVTGRIQ